MISRFPGRRTATLALLALLTTAAAPRSNAADDGEAPPIDRMIGERVANFALTDVRTGRRVGLYGFYGKKAVVIVFTGTECPIGNTYLPRLVALSEKYGDEGVAFLAINANASESVEEVAKHADEYKVGFPVLVDPSGRAAGSLQAERTCEALVLDGTAKLRYRGAIDDQYGYGVRKAEPEVGYLADAIEAVIKGERPDPAATPVVGCPIERDGSMASNLPTVRGAPEVVVEALAELEPEIDPESIGPVTYNAEVGPILRNRCSGCHRPGQVGPFALLDYGDAKRWSASIGEVVDDRRMPPWHADPRFGEFHNDRHLSPIERATLIAWADQGAPEGDPAASPAVEAEPEATDDATSASVAEGWSIGAPDVVFEIPEPYTVQADGALPYQHFRVKTNFAEDRWVSAIQTKPTARAAVHHIIVYLEEPGDNGRNRDGFEGMEHLVGYAPGDVPSIFPEGAAKKVPARIGVGLPDPLHADRQGGRGPHGRRDGLRRRAADSAGPHAPDRQHAVPHPPRGAFARGEGQSDIRHPRRRADRPVPAHALAREGFQVHRRLSRRHRGGPALGPPLRLRLAELLLARRAQAAPARDEARMRRPLRQLRRQPPR